MSRISSTPTCAYPVAGAAIVDAITPGTLNVRTTLGGGTSIVRGLFIEMFMTAMLMLAMYVIIPVRVELADTLLVFYSPLKSTRQLSWRPSVLGKCSVYWTSVTS